jgi:hypothetical protein
MFTTTTMLSANHQLAIPIDLCEQQHWHIGQQLVLIPKENGVLLMPAPSAEQLVGIAKQATNHHGYRDRQDRF